MNQQKAVSKQKFDQFMQQHPEYSPEAVIDDLESKGFVIDFNLQEEVKPVVAEQPSVEAPVTQSSPIDIPMRPSWEEPEAKGLGQLYGEYATQHLPQSALQFGKDVGTAVAHPWQTTKGMGALAKSAIAFIKNKAIGDDSGKGEEVVNALAQMYVDRYGSSQAAMDTAYYDPVGFLGDASLLITGIGAGVGGAAKVAGWAGRVPRLGVVGRAAPRIARASQELKTVSDVVDIGQFAMGAAAKGTLKAGKAVHKLTPRLWQQAVLAPTRVPKWVAQAAAVTLAKVTGTSPVAVDATVRIYREKGLFEISEDSRAWRRGAGRPDKAELIGITRDAVEEYRSNRGLEYSQTRGSLDLANKPVSVSGLEEAFQNIQDEFEFDMDAPVGERYQRSTLFGESESGHLNVTLDKVKAFLDGVSGRTDDGIYTVDDLNAKELDKLKQQLDNRMEKMTTSAEGTSSRSKRALSELRNAIRQELSQVEGYDDLTRRYEEASELLQGLHETLDFKVMDKVAQDQALKKVLDILKTDREYGRQLLSRLEDQTQTPLFAEIVGAQFAGDLPDTVTGPRIGQRGESLHVAVALGAVAPLAQPVFWGEVLRAIGWGGRGVDEAVDFMTRNRSKLVAIAREREEAKRHEEQTDPGFQESKIDPILDKVTNPQQRSALQQIADQGIRANRDVDRLLESITRSPKY